MSSAAGPRIGVAFLLAQLGAHASERFAAALAAADLNPGLAGILRILRTDPGITQQELATRLGILPSRLVGIIDDLEARGWVARSRGTADRRVNLLTLTEIGSKAFAEIATVARNHEKAMTAGLDDSERATLLELLTKLADRQGLTPGVHPGYRTTR